MRYLLVNHHTGGSTVATEPTSSQAGPKFTLALLVLVGFCALMGVAWLFFKLFRLCKPRQLQSRVPSATVSGVSSAQGRDGSWRHRNNSASLSGPFLSDLEQADTADSLTVVERTDSMVTRASAWARAILSGEHSSPPPPSLPRSTSNNNKPWDTVSIPVKQAIVIMQPDGEATLGISEVKQRDVMVQVDEEDLIREATNSAMSFGNTSTTTTSQYRRQQRRYLVDEGSQCPGQYSRENSRSQLEQAVAAGENVVQAIEVVGLNTSNIETSMDQFETVISAEIEASGSSLPATEREDQHDRRQRRRRKRRKGTCEVSCQTD